MTRALPLLALLACSTQVESNGCPHSDADIALELAVARVLVERETGADPGELEMHVSCWGEFNEERDAYRKGCVARVLPYDEAALSGYAHEGVHKGLDLVTGDGDGEHVREVWAWEPWRGVR